jgi:hypothetical protein
MRIGSAWLQALASPAPMLDTLVIYSPHDNFVMPQANLQLPGAPATRSTRSVIWRCSIRHA